MKLCIFLCAATVLAHAPPRIELQLDEAKALEAGYDLQKIKLSTGTDNTRVSLFPHGSSSCTPPRASTGETQDELTADPGAA